MSVAEALRARVELALRDAELPRHAKGLELVLALRCEDQTVLIKLEGGQGGLTTGETPDITVAGASGAWSQLLASPPPPRFQSFTALALVNPEFTVSGDPLRIAQARGWIERLVERVINANEAPAAPVARNIRQITGGYHPVTADSETYEIYIETAGQGVPVLLLHTAGADSRQFQAQLSDTGLTANWQFFAPDMPFHGRSMPPLAWNGAPYTLTAQRYLDWCAAIIEQVIKTPVIVAGGSMGAGMALWLAAARPDLVRGVIAIEPPFQSRGRRNPFQHHAQVHAGLHNAAFVRGLMSPTSPEARRRRAAWIYSQGAPEIYSGDLAFYSEEFDGAEVGPRVDATKTPVALLCGTYDYSATPADGARLAALIPGAQLDVMEGLGHFPMTEHPDLFRPHLINALAWVAR